MTSSIDHATRPRHARLALLRQVLAAVLLVAWVVILVVAVLGREREVPATELRDDLASGEVDRVAFVAFREDVLVADVALRWERGLAAKTAQVTVVREGAPDFSDDPTTLRAPVRTALQQIDPDVQVVRVETLDEATDSFATPGVDWRVPERAAWAVTLVGLATIGLLVLGPPTERATKWAWWWLTVGLSPPGAIAFLVLGGSLRPEPRPGPGRLTGGKVFLLSLLAGLALSVLLD